MDTDDDRRKNAERVFANWNHDLVVVMQAAIIEWQSGRGAEAAMEWIANTLDGPGLIPSPNDLWGKDAQMYFNANRAEPMPVCSCGRPSHIGWMGKGFCSDEHFRAAKAASMN